MAKIGDAAKGGAARAGALDSETRSAIARRAAEVRWQQEPDGVPVAEFPGRLVVGDLVLPCAVLQDSQRIISERAVGNVLVRSGAQRRKREAQGTGLPLAISADNIGPLVPQSLRIALATPIMYKNKNGRVSYGVPAELIPEICEVWLKARDNGLLQKQQFGIANRAEVLMRGLARVGIIALVDEVTGYQDVRDRDALNKILEAYVAKELMPWAKRFPDEFYEQMFRLWGWQYKPLSVKRPKHVGRLAAELVYEKLPPGVLKELRERNPVGKDGRRRRKHHQFLTENVGHPHLDKHIASVTTLMRVAPSRAVFKRLFDKAFPPKQPRLFENDDEEDGDY